MPFPSGADWPSIVMKEQSPRVISEQEQTPPSIAVTVERPSIVMLKQQTQQPIDVPTLSDLRQMCDDCYPGAIEIDDEDDIPCGGSFTFTNAYKVDHLRQSAEIILKFYNENSHSNFKLLKVCKANIITGFDLGLTCMAKDDESGECLVFQGFLDSWTTPLYCEIKYDDIKLLPDDDDYLRPESEDSPPVLSEQSPRVISERSIVMVEQEQEQSPRVISERSIVMVEQEQEQTPPSIVETVERPSTVMLKGQTPQPIDVPTLSDLRQMCDDCYPGAIEIDDEDDIPCGGSFTFTNAYKVDHLRQSAEIILKFYNENSHSNFKLLKVCKANIITGFDLALTCMAREDESGECLVFQGFLDAWTTPLYCEIKLDDIKLLPDDDDYVGPESGDSPPVFRCENDDAEDGSADNSWIKAMMARAHLPWW